MKKLLSYADFNGLEHFDSYYPKWKEEFSLDGIELIQFQKEDFRSRKQEVKGYHLRFFPSWLKTYLEAEDKIEDFALSGGSSKEEILLYYKEELQRAQELEVDYVIFHACHVMPGESLDYLFEYSDLEVLEVVADFINEVFTEEDYGFSLLFENLWWPGLRFQKKEELDVLFSHVNYKRTGLALDTGHLLHCNLELSTMDEALSYLYERVEALEEYKEKIEVIHLNYSLSSDYVKEAIEKYRREGRDQEMSTVYQHIFHIDYHEPFCHPGIRNFIESIQPNYLVYEIIAYPEAKLEKKLREQRNYI